MSKKEITARQIGQNIIMVINGDKYSKRFPNKAEREDIFNKVEAYNKRPSNAKEKALIMVMSDAKEEKVKKEAKVKDIKKTVATKKKPSAPKGTTKKASPKEIAAAQKLLETNGYNVSKQAPRRRTGEY